MLIRAYYVLTYVLVMVRSNTASPSGLGSDDEGRLVHYLFEKKGYNELIRPVSQLNHTVKVSFGLAMIQLIHVEEKSQIMKSNVWLRMMWNDYQLVWDPADFGGIKVIRMSPNKIWKPDIVLFNNADGKYEVSWRPNILVHSDSSILWIPPAIYKSSCTIDVKYFPFDEQNCEMKFGSWTFDATQVVLDWYERSDKVDLSNYWKSGTWDIVKCPGRVVNITKRGQPKQTQIVFTIVLRRKTLFYTVNLIIPCVLISFLSVCVFYLPADAGEKMTLCISILLALVVFLLLVSKILPPTSISIPLISKFLLFTFIMNIFTIVITVIIINWNYRTPRTHKMHRWVKLLFMNYLPRLLLMKRPEHIIREEERRLRMTQMTLSSSRCNGRGGDLLEAGVTSPAAESLRRGGVGSGMGFRAAAPLDDTSSIEMGDMSDTAAASSHPHPHHHQHHPNCRLIRSGAGAADDDDNDYTAGDGDNDDVARDGGLATSTSRRTAARRGGNMSSASARAPPSPPPPISVAEAAHSRFGNFDITPDMRKAIAAINFISTHLRIEDEYNRVLQDWKYVASVIDRVQLVIFITVTIGGTIGILMNAPYILETVDQDKIIKEYSPSS